MVLLGVAIGILAAFQQFKLPPVMPVMLADYGYAPVLAGAMMSVFAVAGLILSIWTGKSAGRNMARLLALAISTFLAGNMLGLWAASDPWLMLASRALEGVGTAIAGVVGAILAAEFASDRHRPIAIALFSAWIPFGQLLAIATGLPAIAYQAWQISWIASAILTVCIGLWAWRLRMALRTKPTPNTASTATGRRRYDVRILAASGAFVFWSAQYFAFMTWVPQYLVAFHGFEPADAVWIYTIAPAMVVAGTLLARQLMRSNAAFGLGLAGSMVIQLCVWFTAPAMSANLWGAVAIAAFGISAGVTPTLLLSLPGRLNPTNTAPAFGLLMTGRNMGILVGPILLPQIMIWGWDWQDIPYVFGLFTLAALMAAITIVFFNRKAL